jgi:hypothetical protein
MCLVFLEANPAFRYNLSLRAKRGNLLNVPVIAMPGFSLQSGLGHFGKITILI